MCSYSSCDLETCGKLKDFDICEDHFRDLYTYFIGILHNWPIANAIAKGQLQHSTGYTYMVLTTSGLVKIGYTGGVKEHYLRSRIRHAVEDLDGVSVLAIFDGGMTMEACIHRELRFHRIPGSELFRPQAETVEVISRGNTHELIPRMNEYINKLRSGTDAST